MIVLEQELQYHSTLGEIFLNIDLVSDHKVLCMIFKRSCSLLFRGSAIGHKNSINTLISCVQQHLRIDPLCNHKRTNTLERQTTRQFWALNPCLAEQQFTCIICSYLFVNRRKGIRIKKSREKSTLISDRLSYYETLFRTSTLYQT